MNITPSFDGISTSLCLWKSIRWSIRQSVSPLLSDMFTLIIENQYYSTTASSPCFSLRSTGYAKLEWHFMQSPHPSVSILWLRRRNLVVATSCSHNLLSCLASIIFELLQGLLNWQSSQYNVNDRS